LPAPTLLPAGIIVSWLAAQPVLAILVAVPLGCGVGVVVSAAPPVLSAEEPHPANAAITAASATTSVSATIRASPRLLR
jgi:hypothetical protein